MAKCEFLHQLIFEVENHSYPVYIGLDCLEDFSLLNRHIAGKQVLIVTNETLASLFLEKIRKAFDDLQCDIVILPDGEMHKAQPSLSKICNALVENHHHRDTTLIALGGGVIGDITGFAASIYQRGVRLIQIPTTLLAQVDSSIGGKTAINHPLGKNMLGTFYHPHAVIIDLNTLDTLPSREYRSGMAEIIKYGLLEGDSFLNQIEKFIYQNIKKTETLIKIISKSCAIKAEIVKQDERELGKRALLNLGHTFAHALEAYTHYKYWLHGEAVAIGLYCAALLSFHLGFLSVSDLQRIDLLLKAAGLPRRIPKDANLTEIYELMLQDKKIKDSTLRFVLLKSPGTCFIADSIAYEDVHFVLRSALEGEVK